MLGLAVVEGQQTAGVEVVNGTCGAYFPGRQLSGKHLRLAVEGNHRQQHEVSFEEVFVVAGIEGQVVEGWILSFHRVPRPLHHLQYHRHPCPGTHSWILELLACLASFERRIYPCY